MISDLAQVLFQSNSSKYKKQFVFETLYSCLLITLSLTHHKTEHSEQVQPHADLQ